VPDDGPMWPKHVVQKVALKTVKLSVKNIISNVVCSQVGENTRMLMDGFALQRTCLGSGQILFSMR
jgi:hypothetical protein